jgi:hypothetical protein
LGRPDPNEQAWYWYCHRLPGPSGPAKPFPEPSQPRVMTMDKITHRLVTLGLLPVLRSGFLTAKSSHSAPMISAPFPSSVVLSYAIRDKKRGLNYVSGGEKNCILLGRGHLAWLITGGSLLFLSLILRALCDLNTIHSQGHGSAQELMPLPSLGPRRRRLFFSGLGLRFVESNGQCLGVSDNHLIPRL